MYIFACTKKKKYVIHEPWIEKKTIILIKWANANSNNKNNVVNMLFQECTIDCKGRYINTNYSLSTNSI